MGTFVQRIAVLRDNVGGGRLVGSIVIDQIYARYQHERHLHHPRGGRSKFLTTGLVETGPRAFQTMANQVLRGSLNIAMARGTENVVKTVRAYEPKEFGTMANSATVRVTDRGRVVYYRRGAPRLNDPTINALRDATNSPNKWRGGGRRRR